MLEYSNEEVVAVGKTNVEEYLQKGMYGAPQIKADERKKFLGTLRERIVVALTNSQVMEKGVYPEVEQLMKEHPKASLLLNGCLDYKYLSDYISVANKHNVPFSIVTNKDHHTDIGLVLTYDYAIDKEEIYITKKADRSNNKQEKKKKKSKIFSGLYRFLKK